MRFARWFVLGGLWSFAALAEDVRPPVVVMDLDAKGVSTLQAGVATQSVARGLRELDVFQVLSSADVRELLALERNRQIQGNEGKMSDLGRVLGAQYVVVGSVTGMGASDFEVEIRLLDTAKGVVIGQKRLGPLTGIDRLAGQLSGLAQELVAPVLKDQQGTLFVQCPEEAAEVLIDEVLVASTPVRNGLKLSRGTHRLQLRKDGFIAQTIPVRIVPDQATVQSVTLIPSADYVEAFKQRNARLRVGAYLATAGAVLAIGGAIVFDRAVSDPLYQSQFRPRQLALSGTAQSDLPASVSGDPKRLATYQQCGLNPTTCRSEISSTQGQLVLQQIVTGGLVVIGLGSAGLATYLWLTGKDPNRYTGLVAGVMPGPAPRFALSGSF